MANSSVAIQVLPSVNNDEQLLSVVDEVIAYIKSFNLPTVVGPFETTIEGDYDELMEILKGCSKICIEKGSNGVMTYAKINYNPHGVFTIDSKIAKHQ
ncbi:MAG: thiamine-binding protein [Eubacteriales bacterium]|nr:thiamine-binding protein [Eubacteriales bacterium]MDY3332837.1 thiamine-binding protein [Gallibacter sp.]